MKLLNTQFYLSEMRQHRVGLNQFKELLTIKIKKMKKNYLLCFMLIINIVFCLNAQNHSMDFDVTDDYIDVGTNLNLEYTASFSIEAWIKTDNSFDLQQIVSKLDSNFRGWGFQLVEGRLSGYLFSDFLVNQIYLEGLTNVADNNWHHVAMVYNSETNTILLYIDGNLETGGIPNDLGTMGTIINTGKVLVGAYDANGFPGEYWDGKMDELRIWNKALSSSEITNNYNTEIDGSQTDLLLYYKFDITNSSCDIEDASLSLFHGARVGESGANNLPQFSTDIPMISDVANANSNDCTLLNVVDFEQKSSIKLHPNPSTNFIKIEGLTKAENYKLFNALGVLVTSGDVSNNEKIDIKNLTNGVYFLKLDKQQSIKIIKR